MPFGAPLHTLIPGPSPYFRRRGSHDTRHIHLKKTKHVVILNGSSRKATTHSLLKQIAALLEAQHIETTLIDLTDHQISDCIGCEICIRQTGRCFHADDAEQILAQFREADGIVLASPVYVMNVAGKLKSLIDKTASWIHRPPMVGKPALLVATTAGSGLKDVLDYLEQVVIQWGAHPAGKIGRSVMQDGPVAHDEIESFIWHLNHPTSLYRPSLRQIIFYQVQKVLALKVLDIDREHWEENGWDREAYYYRCRISPIKRWVAWAMYQILYRRVQPR